jgi:hypothetical protein
MFELMVNDEFPKAHRDYFWGFDCATETSIFTIMEAPKN